MVSRSHLVLNLKALVPLIVHLVDMVPKTIHRDGPHAVSHCQPPRGREIGGRIGGGGGGGE